MENTNVKVMKRLETAYVSNVAEKNKAMATAAYPTSKTIRRKRKNADASAFKPRKRADMSLRKKRPKESKKKYYLPTIQYVTLQKTIGPTVLMGIKSAKSFARK